MDEIYKKGKQPCEKFTPEVDSMGRINQHVCIRCDKTVSFCVKCSNDHHEQGYNTCKGK